MLYGISGPSLWGPSGGDHLQPIERELNSQVRKSEQSYTQRLGSLRQHITPDSSPNTDHMGVWQNC